MRNISVITLMMIAVCYVSSFGIERNSIARYHRLLRAYDYPVYRASDRDIIFDARYSTTNNERSNTSSQSMGGNNLNQSFDRECYGSAGVEGRWITSSPATQFSQWLKVTGSGQYSGRTEISTNSYLSLFDSSKTAEQDAVGSVNYSSDWRRYLFAEMPLLKDFFFAIDGIASIKGTYSRDRQHRASNTTGNGDERRLQTTTRTREGYCASNANPSIGYGRRLPIAPVYRAFEVERKLKRNGSIRGNLTDSTILKLAALCGSLQSFRLAHDRPDKHFMQQLSIIIRTDPAIDTARFDTFALFQTYETFEEQFPYLFRGLEIKLRPTLHAQYRYYSRDPAMVPERFPEDNFTFDWYFKNMLQIDWTLPLTSRFFAKAGIAPPYELSVFDDIQEYNSGFIGAGFLVTNRIVLEASTNDIPLWLVFPDGTPSSINLSATIFLEDRLSLELQANKRFRTQQDERMIVPGTKSGSEYVTMRVKYDF